MHSSLLWTRLATQARMTPCAGSRCCSNQCQGLAAAKTGTRKSPARVWLKAVYRSRPPGGGVGCARRARPPKGGTALMPGGTVALSTCGVLPVRRKGEHVGPNSNTNVAQCPSNLPVAAFTAPGLRTCICGASRGQFSHLHRFAAGTPGTSAG